MRTGIFASLILGAFLAEPAVSAQALHPQAVITPSATGQVTRFAKDIAVDGNRVIVGAAEGAFIFSRSALSGDSWSQDQFLASRAYTFGAPVALRGNVALFGDSGADFAAQQAGAAKIWSRPDELTPYALSQTFWPADSIIHDQFGSDVALGDGFAFIGADNDDHNGKQSTGSVTLYQQIPAGGFQEIRKFAPPDVFGGSAFGGSLDLDNDRLVVGAQGGGAGFGAAYVFERNAGGIDGWGQVAKLDFPGRFYGEAVAIDNSTIVVSRTSVSTVAGAVDIYDRDEVSGNWNLSERLFHPASVNGDRYGRSVAISGDLLAIAADGTSDRAAVSVYRRNLKGTDWDLIASISPPTGVDTYDFGTSLSIMDNLVLVGSLGFGEENLGAVYVYAVPEPATVTIAGCCMSWIAAGVRRARRYRLHANYEH